MESSEAIKERIDLNLENIRELLENIGQLLKLVQTISGSSIVETLRQKRSLIFKEGI